MKKAVLNSEWHGVPAGTALAVIGSYIDVQDNEILIVEREDKALLPGPWGQHRTANIAPEFINIGQQQGRQQP